MKKTHCKPTNRFQGVVTLLANKPTIFFKYLVQEYEYTVITESDLLYQMVTKTGTATSTSRHQQQSCSFGMFLHYRHEIRVNCHGKLCTSICGTVQIAVDASNYKDKCWRTKFLTRRFHRRQIEGIIIYVAFSAWFVRRWQQSKVLIFECQNSVEFELLL